MQVEDGALEQASNRTMSSFVVQKLETDSRDVNYRPKIRVYEDWYQQYKKWT